MNLGSLTLENGQVLSDVTIAYDTYGRLAPDGRNAILITHGYTSNHHAAGRYGPADSKVGWWDRLIGPGKAIDTARFFVVSSNVLGSCYGTTGPGSLNPATGKPYGPEFPDLTMRDIVVAQREFLIRLGVTHLVAVAGPSLGGRQAFQWAVTYPDFMDGIVAVASSPKGLGKDDAVHHLMQRSVDRSQLERRLVLRAGRDHPYPHRHPHGDPQAIRYRGRHRYRPPQS